MVSLDLKEGEGGKSEPVVMRFDRDLGALKDSKKESLEERWEGEVGKGSAGTSGSHEYLENKQNSLFCSPAEGE